jgi:hypothetical protein
MLFGETTRDDLIGFRKITGESKQERELRRSGRRVGLINRRVSALNKFGIGIFQQYAISFEYFRSDADRFQRKSDFNIYELFIWRLQTHFGRPFHTPKARRETIMQGMKNCTWGKSSIKGGGTINLPFLSGINKNKSDGWYARLCRALLLPDLN